MKATEMAGNKPLTIKNILTARTNMQPVIAHTGNGGEGRQDHPQKAAGPGQDAVPTTGRPAEERTSVVSNEFEPPPGFIKKIFEGHRVPAKKRRRQAQAIAAQYRRDKAGVLLRDAEERAANREEEQDEAVKRLDELHTLHEGYTAEYERLWPGDHPAPFSETPRQPRRQESKEPTLPDPLARKLRIVKVDSGTTRAQEILAEHPEVAAAYDSYLANDIAKARTYAQDEIVFFNSGVLPDLRRDTWKQQFAEPVTVILEGLNHLLGDRRTMHITTAEVLINEEIRKHSHAGNWRLRDLYSSLRYEWPHIISLHQKGGIETTSATFEYFRILHERIREE